MSCLVSFFIHSFISQIPFFCNKEKGKLEGRKGGYMDYERRNFFFFFFKQWTSGIENNQLIMDFSKKSVVDWVLSQQFEQTNFISRKQNFKTVFLHGDKGVALLTLLTLLAYVRP